MNPFISLYHDPVGVLTAIGYAVFLLALTVWTLAAVSNLIDRGWTHVVWLGNAWDWRHTDRDYGPEWNVLPPKTVANRVSLLGFHLGVAVALLAVDLWAIAAVIYVLS